MECILKQVTLAKVFKICCMIEILQKKQLVSWHGFVAAETYNRTLFLMRWESAPKNAFEAYNYGNTKLVFEQRG